MCQDTCEPIFFEIWYDVKHCYTIQSDSSLKGHRVTEKQNLCSPSVGKLQEVTRMFVMVDYIRKLMVKKFCKYGKYESFDICSSFLLVCLFACLFVVCFCMIVSLFVFVEEDEGVM